MMSNRLVTAISLILLCLGLDSNAQDMHEAIRLYDNGMYSRARTYFEDVASAGLNADPEGYAVLCDVRQNVPGYTRTMNRFLADNPQSPHIPQILYAHGLILFDAQDYAAAGEVFKQVKARRLDKSQRTEFTFLKAYCALDQGQMQEALRKVNSVR